MYLLDSEVSEIETSPVSVITLVLRKIDLRQADHSIFLEVNHPWLYIYHLWTKCSLTMSEWACHSRDCIKKQSVPWQMYSRHECILAFLDVLQHGNHVKLYQTPQSVCPPVGSSSVLPTLLADPFRIQGPIATRVGGLNMPWMQGEPKIFYNQSVDFEV